VQATSATRFFGLWFKINSNWVFFDSLTQKIDWSTRPSAGSLLGHLSEFGDNGGDRILLTHVVESEAGEGDTSIEITNQIHILQLLDNWIFEAFLE